METLNNGQIAFVTGGGSGIGRAISKRLAQLGATVLVADISGESASETVSLLETPTKQAHESFALDVTDINQVRKTMAYVKEKYHNIDILMNNAGISAMHSLEDATEQQWDQLFSVNVKGMFLVTQAALPLMKELGGRIINTCSMAAVKPDPVMTPYTATKFAVLGFTKSVALELAKYNITVNCISPGYIKTAMQTREVVWEGKMRGLSPEDVFNSYVEKTPLHRIGLPEDVANVVGLLVSPQASFITGTNVDITGGAHLS